MRKTILLLISSFILFGCNHSSRNQPSTWKVEEKKIVFDTDCHPLGTEILAELKGACAGNQFEAKYKAENNVNQGKFSYVISSWQQFEQFRRTYFETEYFNKIRKSFFKDNKLGVVLVNYTGSQFIRNEKLSYDKDRCGFRYEIWDRRMDAVPACVWSRLYIVKIKK
jgi:hypothetical protein